MMLCAVLSLGACKTTEVSDSYCSTYQPVVRAAGEGSIAAAAPVKRRILANELTYRELCK